VRFTFRATQGGFNDDGEVLSAGVATGDDWDEEEGHYLNFQRDAEGHRESPQDWEKDGLYIECDDQSCSGYGLIRECRLSRSMMSVDLSEEMEGLEGVEGFDVELAIDEESYGQLRAGLARMIEETAARFLAE